MESPPPREYQEGLARAQQLLQAGAIEAAYGMLSELVQRHPGVAEIHDDLAIVLVQKLEFQSAEKHFQAAVEIDPASAPYRCNYGNILQALKKIDAAIVQFKWALRLDGTLADAHYNLANAYTLKQEWATAIEYYNAAIKLRPAWPLAYLNRGNAWAALGDDALALSDYSAVIKLSPNEVGVYLNRAKVYFASNQLIAALADCRCGLTIKPSLEDLQFMLAQVLLGLGQPETVVPELTERYGVNQSRAYLFLGSAYSESGQINSAIKALAESLKYDERNPEALGLMGQCYLLRGQYKGAIQLFQKAIECKSDSVVVRQNLVQAHQVCGEIEEAIAINRTITPSERSLGTSIFLAQNISDWSHYKAALDELSFRLSHMAEVEAVEDPWSLFAVCDDPKTLRAVAQRYVQKKLLPGLHGKRYVAPPPADLPVICIGYFSPDLKLHAVSHLLRKLIKQHDRNKFKVIAFSYGRAAPGDEMRKKLESTFDEFLDVESHTDDEIRALALEKGVEIAIDLAGLTGEVRPGLFARRLAPVQVNYLGFVGTTGTPWHDYIIADEVVIPPAHFAHFTEKVVHLPMYMPYDTDLEHGPVVPQRKDFRLPSQGFVFCCFNNNFKITQEVFESWMRILQATPESVLWLKATEAKTQRRLQAHAESCGVNSARLIFAEKLASPNDHLARYLLADLFLDTYPYNAHATAMDALWMGLPLLTREGMAMHARVAASVLKSVGIDELVVGDAASYEQLAIRLAQQPSHCAQLRQKLERARSLGSLFSMDAYTRHLEKAYVTMSERCRQGLGPAHFRSHA